MIPVALILEMATSPVTAELFSSLLTEVKSAIAAGTSEVKSVVSAVHTKLDTEVATLHTKLDSVNTSINNALPGGLGTNSTLVGIEAKVDDAMFKSVDFADKVVASANNALNPGSTSGTTTPAAAPAPDGTGVPPTPMANISYPGTNISIAGLPNKPNSGTSTPVPAGQQSPAEKAMDTRITALTFQVSNLQAQLEALQKQLADEQPTKDLNEERLKAVELAALKVPDLQKTLVQHGKKLNTVSLHQAGLQQYFTSITPLNSEANTVESSPEASPPAVDTPKNPVPPSVETTTSVPPTPTAVQIISPP